MTKVKLPLLALLFILMNIPALSQDVYRVSYVIIDSQDHKSRHHLETSFADQDKAVIYLGKLPLLLWEKGFVTASVDSVLQDSLAASVLLYLGRRYQWSGIKIMPSDRQLLEQARWYLTEADTISFETMKKGEAKLLDHLEDFGYPFARITIDSIRMQDDRIEGNLKIDKGPLYKIDSIRIYGDARVSNELLQRYLEIPNGSIYSRKKLKEVDRKLALLQYVTVEKPSDLTMLGTGSVLNLYINSRKTNQVNALVGLLPDAGDATSRKFQLAGEANILLRNALGKGETIGLNWQQLQLRSPRLNLLFEHPYVMKSAFGIALQFDMFRKDTTFLNLNMKAGADYKTGHQQASVFYQRLQTIVNGVNVNKVIYSRQLPDEADVSSNNLGVSYEYDHTDYRFNPLKGFNILFTGTAGIKRIRPNNQVIELEDPSDPSFKYEQLYDTVLLKTYQARVTASAASYLKLGKQSALKTALSAGLYSSGNTFKNELFQVGGYKLLRGFDEESQYLSSYAIGTLEYRYLLDRNSRLYAFADYGLGGQPARFGPDHKYLGTGLGLSFETKPGIFNLAWAIGKRDDLPFNLRQSKVHFGFVSYF